MNEFTVDTTYQRAIDISAWNWEMNFDIAKPLVDFVMVRGGFGTWRDERFDSYKADLQARGIPFGIYWYVYVGSINMDLQVNAFVTVLNEGGWRFPPTADFETTTLGPDETTAWIKSFMAKLKTKMPGVKLMIYTSPGWWNSNVRRNTWAREFYLWNAHWTGLPVPTIPLDWTSCLIWQWSADRNGLGKTYGSSGDYDMDLNRFMGTATEWQLFAGEVEPIDPPEPVDGYLVLVSGLSIRTGSGTGFAWIGSRPFGDVVHPIEYELWVKDIRGWSAVRSGGKDYMAKNDPPKVIAP